MTPRARDASLRDSLRAVLALCAVALALPFPAAALGAASSHASHASRPPARQLLDHDASWFRAQMHGGAHNALDPGRDVSDQVTQTTCLPSDAFVRVAGDGKTFELRGEPWVFAGWNQWEVLEAASNAPPPFRIVPNLYSVTSSGVTSRRSGWIICPTFSSSVILDKTSAMNASRPGSCPTADSTRGQSSAKVSPGILGSAASVMGATPGRRHR